LGELIPLLEFKNLPHIFKFLAWDTWGIFKRKEAIWDKGEIRVSTEENPPQDISCGRRLLRRRKTEVL